MVAIRSILAIALAGCALIGGGVSALAQSLPPLPPPAPGAPARFIFDPERINAEGAAAAQNAAFFVSRRFIREIARQSWTALDDIEPSVADRFPPRRGVRTWVSAYVGCDVVRGEPEQNRQGYVSPSASTTRQMHCPTGGLGGFDVRVTPDIVLGLAVGLARDRFTLNDDGTRGLQQGPSTAAYGSWSIGPWFARAIVGYGRHDFDTTRRTVQGGLLTNNFAGNQLMSFTEGGYRFPIGPLRIVPFFNVQVDRLSQGGYTETDPNLPPLSLFSVAPRVTTARRTQGGFRMSGQFDWEGFRFKPRIEVTWVREYGRDRYVNAAPVGNPTQLTRVDGARPVLNATFYSAELEVSIPDFDDDLVFYIAYDGNKSRRGQGNAVSSGVRMRW
jgi:uncharacterized protein YhjY with autotransporter beta-barrel domain